MNIVETFDVNKNTAKLPWPVYGRIFVWGFINFDTIAKKLL